MPAEVLVVLSVLVLIIVAYLALDHYLITPFANMDRKPAGQFSVSHIYDPPRLSMVQRARPKVLVVLGVCTILGVAYVIVLVCAELGVDLSKISAH